MAEIGQARGSGRPIGDTGFASGLINSVRAAATYELVVEEIRRAIYLGRFLPGDKLPSERDLANQMGVSRTTIREAIRKLEGERLISVRRGATGGIQVLTQTQMSKAQIEAYMETQRNVIDSVCEFRLANECAAASLAAERRTEQHLKRLAKALANMGALCMGEARERVSSIALFWAADSEFHLTIGQASMNELLLKAVEDGRAAMFLPVGRVFTRLADSANDHHEELFEAIKSRSPERAAASMRDHIEATRASLHAFLPKGRRNS
jgi:DNA-binding FadR family transcriptional regulator